MVEGEECGMRRGEGCGKSGPTVVGKVDGVGETVADTVVVVERGEDSPHTPERREKDEEYPE